MTTPTAPVDGLNEVADDALRRRLTSCCAARSWVDALVGQRPYGSVAELLAASDRATAGLDADGLAQALAGHPRIGSAADAHRADERSASWSRGEQAGVDRAGAELRAELAAANADYERRFGHVYLVCAAGRDAAELLELCRARLGNDPQTERGVVLGELAAINRLRLGKLMAETR